MDKAASFGVPPHAARRSAGTLGSAHMRSRHILASAYAALLCASGCAAAADIAAGATQPPVTVSVDAHESHIRELLMVEVDDIATACHYFRELFGRWPQSLKELMAITEGVDYSIFPEAPTLTPLPDDTERFRFFDGKNWWERKLTRMTVEFPPAVLKAAQSPGFKIRIE